ncbi:hypothetical protein VCRA2128O305_10061 [Vibrio crassostreae]|nr:hypothetical protein EDB14_1832 [Vibrio crassostreae]TCT67636.1 hypothetical protein EDB44_101684 [Vibrio crassostreae]TCT86933.1 hypothetical protein EDB43_10158 [Vibrio crassostreae]TCU07892.1 hypothetical protein EDB47_10258 [Vibrio crassostreae]TDW13298.1 hypothetical protein EDB45_10157 [Vibrio crassostreae]
MKTDKKLWVNGDNFEQLVQLTEQSGKPVGYELNRILGSHFDKSTERDNTCRQTQTQKQ